MDPKLPIFWAHSVIAYRFIMVNGHRALMMENGNISRVFPFSLPKRWGGQNGRVRRVFSPFEVLSRENRRRYDASDPGYCYEISYPSKNKDPGKNTNVRTRRE
jgi:hypothetical protein